MVKNATISLPAKTNTNPNTTMAACTGAGVDAFRSFPGVARGSGWSALVGSRSDLVGSRPFDALL